MEEKLDLRVKKTYKALIETFTCLMQEKGFENITVNELCTRAMVRRATFYKHFADKYEFFSFFVRQIQTEYRKNTLQRDGVQLYADIIGCTLDFMDENESLVRAATESSAFPVLLDLVAEQIFLDVKQLLSEEEKKGIDLRLPVELLAQAYTGALINVARWWIKNKHKMGKQELTERAGEMFGRLFAVSE